MAPLSRSARRPRPRKPRAFLTSRDDLEIRIVPALIGSGAAAIASSVLVPPGTPPIQPDGGSGSPNGYTPQQIQTAYGVDGIRFGSITGDGAGQTIAIVDAYDEPGLVDSAASNFSTSDLARFDQAFGLPDPPSFTKLNQYGDTTGLPGTDPAGPGSPSGNWEYEEAMDVEWAHAIAPAASIVLVEANSNGFDDLSSAIIIGADLPGVSAVSVSWGSSEFSGESFWDTYFKTPSGHQGVTFVAASGDGGSPGIYPAASPNVVAAGGTTLRLGSDGSYEGESAWSSSGGGVSSYESEPSYQEGVQSTGSRTTPDVAFVADRSTGVAVYDSYDNTGSGPWNEMGGSSLAAPSWAALIAIADQCRVALGGTTLDGATQTLPALYSLPAADFHDITSGSNGGYNAGPGYDEVTGLGTPVANLLIPDLVSYGMPDQLVVTAQPPGSVAAGSPFGLTVEVDSPSGTLNIGATGTVTLSLANNPGGAVLNGTLTATITEGVATFSGLSIDQAGTGHTLLVSGNRLNSATSGPFNVVPAAASQLVISAEPPASLTAGGGFGLTVSVEDPYGNLETGYGGSVTLTLGANSVGGSLGGDLIVPPSGGVAVFSGLTLDQAGDGYAIQVTSPGLTTATTTAFTVIPAAPAQLVITAQPTTSVRAGQTFGVTVAVEDSFGNAEPSYNGELTLALTGGAFGTSLGGNLTTAAVGGVADFSGLSLDRANGGYAIHASGDGLTGASTASFQVIPASATHLVMVAQPPTKLNAGQSFGFTLAAEDPFGNIATSFNGSVSAAMAYDPAGALLSGVLTVDSRNGLASFSGLMVDEAGAGYTLKATAGGLSAITTRSIEVTPEAATRLVVIMQPPSSVTAGGGFGLVARAEAPFGNVDTSFQGVVTASLSPWLDADALGGTSRVSAVNGVARFSDLTLYRAAAGDSLQLASGGLSPATTNPFAVNPAAPTQVVLISQPSRKVPVHRSFSFAAAVEDAFGNIVTNYNGSVSVTLSNNPGHARFHGALTVQAGAGVAVFDGSMSKKRGKGGAALSVSALGLTPATSNVFQVAHPNPAVSVFATWFRHGRVRIHGLRPDSHRTP